MISIKMEMPKSCWNCDFCYENDGDYYCSINYNRLAERATDIPNKTRHSSCPLTEIVTCENCKHRVEASCLKKNCFVYDSFYCKEGESK